jgi:hypothetical protein
LVDIGIDKLIKIAIGFMSIPVGLILKLLPEKLFPEKGNREADFTHP